MVRVGVRGVSAAVALVDGVGGARPHVEHDDEDEHHDAEGSHDDADHQNHGGRHGLGVHRRGVIRDGLRLLCRQCLHLLVVGVLVLLGGLLHHVPLLVVARLMVAMLEGGWNLTLGINIT